MSLDTSSRSPREYRFYDRVILAFTSPIQSMVSWTLNHFISFFQNYLYLLSIHQDNRALLEENRKLLNSIIRLKEIQNENERLRKLLNFQDQFNIPSIVARVIARDISTEFQMIRINKGKNAGIKKNMAVVTEAGIVGKTQRVTPYTSDVVTILDPLSSVDAIVERSRTCGIVIGLTEENCQLKHVLRTDDVQVGDLLISSGMGGIFPKGIVVGTVSQVDRKLYGTTQQVTICPGVHFSKLEEVLVLLSEVDE